MAAVPWALASELPELVEYTGAGLAAQGRLDVVDALESMRVYHCRLQTDHVSFSGVPDLPADYMSDADRERIWIGRPPGVRRRSWGISLDVVRGRIFVLAVSHPGILRPKLAALCDRQPPA